MHSAHLVENSRY